VFYYNRDAIIFQNIQRLFLQHGNGLIMTSFSITSFKKAISEFQEDFAKFPTQQKSNPLFSRSDDPVKHLDALLCREYFDSPECIRPDVRATPSRRSSKFKKNPDSFAYTDWKNSLQPSGC
jgi:hypothetical protein